MLTNPRIGQPACIHYRKNMKSMPYYHRVGRIAAKSFGKPRNHLIQLDFGKKEKVIVPCGNLFTLEQVSKFKKSPANQ